MNIRKLIKFWLEASTEVEAIRRNNKLLKRGICPNCGEKTEKEYCEAGEKTWDCLHCRTTGMTLLKA